MRKKKILEDKDLKEKVLWGLNSTVNILLAFFFILTILRYLLKIPLSLWLNFWIGFWILCLLIFIPFVKKQKNSSIINRLHFYFFIVQILILTIIIHYLGGIETSVVLFYSFFIVYGVFLLPKKYNLPVVLISSLCFFVLVYLEHVKILPHYRVFTGYIFDNQMAIFSRLIIIMTAFFFLLFITRKLSETMSIQTRDLIKAQSKLEIVNLELKNKLEELQGLKNTLEVKVKARTQELEELTGNLEQDVKQRTKELQKKVKDLEKFQKFAIGREMKMVELKKKLKNLSKKKS